MRFLEHKHIFYPKLPHQGEVLINFDQNLILFHTNTSGPFLYHNGAPGTLTYTIDTPIQPN